MSILAFCSSIFFLKASSNAFSDLSPTASLRMDIGANHRREKERERGKDQAIHGAQLGICLTLWQA